MRISTLKTVFAALVLTLSASPALAQQWDMTVGSYHTHLIFHDDRFELHLHDKATPWHRRHLQRSLHRHHPLGW